MKIYIAGPMTGLPELNYPMFNLVESLLRQHLQDIDPGAVIINPAKNFAGRTDLEYEQYIEAALHQVMECDIICLMSGWHDSLGALTEAHVAYTLGKKFMFMDTNTFELEIWNRDANLLFSIGLNTATRIRYGSVRGSWEYYPND